MIGEEGGYDSFMLRCCAGLGNGTGISKESAWSRQAKRLGSVPSYASDCSPHHEHFGAYRSTGLGGQNELVPGAAVIEAPSYPSPDHAMLLSKSARRLHVADTAGFVAVFC